MLVHVQNSIAKISSYCVCAISTMKNASLKIALPCCTVLLLVVIDVNREESGPARIIHRGNFVFESASVYICDACDSYSSI